MLTFLKNYLEYILQSLEQGIVGIDLSQKVILWTPPMEAQFLSEREAIGKPLSELFPSFWEEYRGKIWGDILLHDIMQRGDSRGLLGFPLKTKASQIRYFDLKATPLRDNKREIIGAIVVMNDVTEKIYLENQLLRQARTTSLANLGANVAHEVRNPLNSISLNIQLIKESLENPDESSRQEMIEILDNAITEIKRLNDIIRSFLEFSRPPAPQMLPEDPNQSVRQALTLLAKEAQQADVEIIENLGNLPKISMDRNQVSQVVYNICLNAIQAMRKQGGGKLEVTTLVNKDYVLLELKDNGPGIAPGIKDKLFELFCSTKEEGSGLGLAIAEQIVEQHEGRIVAENNMDRGACSSIYLPISSYANTSIAGRRYP
jgi:PAS domain S-box-containing protein